jgi:hypothetical protein
MGYTKRVKKNELMVGEVYKHKGGVPVKLLAIQTTHPLYPRKRGQTLVQAVDPETMGEVGLPLVVGTSELTMTWDQSLKWERREQYKGLMLDEIAKKYGIRRHWVRLYYYRDHGPYVEVNKNYDTALALVSCPEDKPSVFYSNGNFQYSARSLQSMLGPDWCQQHGDPEIILNEQI